MLVFASFEAYLIGYFGIIKGKGNKICINSLIQLEVLRTLLIIGTYGYLGFKGTTRLGAWKEEKIITKTKSSERNVNL